MIFYSSCPTPRPVRLSEATRTFAWESLNHRWGLDTAAVDAVSLDDVPGIDEMSPSARYDAAIRRIAETAPIRIVDGELVSGAATLGAAIGHMVPVTLHGNKIIGGVSHLTLGFDRAVRIGVDAMENELDRRIAGGDYDTEGGEVLHSMKEAVISLRIWIGRYVRALEEKGYIANAERLRRVPFAPPRGFHEAVQSLWALFSFTRLCGTWPGIGRIDEILGPYLTDDLSAGKITLEEAREILAHFMIKGCEWITGRPTYGGDAQHYQNLVIGGVDENGRDVTNEVSYLVLDILEETGISDFPTAIRVSDQTPERLLKRAAETIRHGGGAVAVYGEDTVLKSLTDFGYPLRIARGFANDGCWEVQIPGHTNFSYSPFDGLALLNNDVLGLNGDVRDYGTYEELYAEYIRVLREKIASIRTNYLNTINSGSWACAEVVSLFEQSCMEKARGYHHRGCDYIVRSPHIGGIADVVNSLYTIRKLVFEDGEYTLKQLLTMAKVNWEGYEEQRQRILKLDFFGNDRDDVDGIMQKLVADFTAIVGEQPVVDGVYFTAGVSTFGRQIGWAPERTPSVHGHKKGEILANNFSPTPSSDRSGALAVIRSLCKCDLSALTCGGALDLKLEPTAADGESGTDAVAAILRAFAKMGGFFLNIDVLSNADLLDAKKHPEDYQTLAVRISGWSARFVTLSEDWQDMIIQRTTQEK